MYLPNTEDLLVTMQQVEPSDMSTFPVTFFLQATQQYKCFQGSVPHRAPDRCVFFLPAPKHLRECRARANLGLVKFRSL